MQLDTITFEDFQVRTYSAGDGAPLLLLHGVGPGTSITANFSSVIDELARHYRVVGMDLVGFGGSARKSNDPLFDFELWVRQARFLAGELKACSPGEPLRIWGQSMGGALALRLAADDTDISHVVATGTGGGHHRVNPPLEKFWTFPQSLAQLRDAMQSSMLDPASITDAMVQTRWDTLQQGDIGPYFGRMMAGDKQALLDSVRIPDEVLRRIAARVLLIHGRDDKPCPYTDNALPLLDRIPRCDAVLLGQCGHTPAREQPAKTLELVFAHLARP
ncbi:alpha/beta fold hydrolase [Hydrogenophaga laconesensis]|uniref:2-hydroxymuconate-semialdehyde hydrolase n=1 Tax=Hydrogenophaga laconesensis TaxID=1805971 RepID=A0ABU1V992_9BURK|nr:alpha/beta fold hydrolase [Hydrogenophaga laconesensis]MDR7094036.1 2-hydroxymuconate-semialdehyde hydrolase [Hydrogenophaga laconesensis]